MRTLCINLDSRPDRWAQVQPQLAKIAYPVERFPAISGDNKPLAFNQSVYACMKLAQGDDLLLLEDDVVFDRGFPQIITYPFGFMSIHYGANIMGSWEMPKKDPNVILPGFYVLPNAWQSHCTLYSKECVQFVLDNMDPTYIDENNCIFDEWFRRNVLSLRRSYVPEQLIAYQLPSITDIWGGHLADYTQCHIDGNRYLASL